TGGFDGGAEIAAEKPDLALGVCRRRVGEDEDRHRNAAAIGRVARLVMPQPHIVPAAPGEDGADPPRDFGGERHAAERPAKRPARILVRAGGEAIERHGDVPEDLRHGRLHCLSKDLSDGAAESRRTLWSFAGRWAVDPA